MKNLFNKSKLAALLALLFVASACESILDVEPRESVDLPQVVNTLTGLQGILIDTYDDMQGGGIYGSALIIQPEIMGENCNFRNAVGWYEGQYFNTAHMTQWNYAIINQPNLIIANAEALRGTTGVSEADVNNLLGEAHALRALLYFVMVNVYAYTPTAIPAGLDRGGVPLVTEPVVSKSEISTPPRAPIADVYALIKSDLNRAIDLLGNSKSFSNNNQFIGQAAAQALLSRVALYNGDYQEVIDMATAAINANQAVLSTRATYAQDWDRALHPESLFSFGFDATEQVNINVTIQNLYTSRSDLDPAYNGVGEYTPSDEFLALLDADDIRNDVLQDGAFGRKETTKFRGNTGVQDIDNVSVIRLSEMYLNRAEANARLGREAEAIADLDMLRQRSLGTAFTPTTASGQDLIDAILVERRIELAFEGHRWFDLKRTGSVVDKTDLNGVVLQPDNFRILAPIPFNETEFNPDIVQNEGY